VALAGLKEKLFANPVFRAAMGSLTLLLLVVVSALGVIYSTHVSRQQFSELQQMVWEENELNVEWGQLLLEESAQSSHNRVERLARTKLKMSMPELDNAVIVVQ
jgi:cell division protein FtsL